MVVVPGGEGLLWSCKYFNNKQNPPPKKNPTNKQIPIFPINLFFLNCFLIDIYIFLFYDDTIRILIFYPMVHEIN